MTATLPTDFIQRLHQIIPADKQSSVLDCFDHRFATSFRINTLKASHTQVLPQLHTAGLTVSPITWQESAFVVPSEQRPQLTHSPAAQLGHIYIQNLSSMLPVIALDPQPGEEILDLAAAPGGKTLHIAALMQNQGRVAAVEAVKSRFFRLRQNIQLHGANIVATYLKDGRLVGKQCPERFDRVLLDAPCSSEAGFSLQDPTTFAYWSLNKIKQMQRKQWALLQSAWASLKPGGLLVYSTCTFAPEENEIMVDRLLQRHHAQAELESLLFPIDNTQAGLTYWQEQTFDSSLHRCLRIIPDGVMNAFFVAKIRKHPL